MLDRSGEFSQYSRSVSPQSEVAQPKTGIGKEEEFFRTVEDIKAKLSTSVALAKEIETCHKQAITAIDPTATQKLSQIIQQKTETATALLATIRTALSSTLQPLSTPNPHFQSQYKVLAKKFMDTIKDFETMQTSYRAKYRKQIQRQYLIINPQATEEELECVSIDPQTMQHQLFAMASRHSALQALQAMQQRHAEMEIIEKSVEELARLFEDMAFIVKQQGEMIMRVEQHVDQLAADVEKGKTYVSKGLRLAQKMQRYKWLVIIGAVALLLAVFKLLKEFLRF